MTYVTIKDQAQEHTDDVVELVKDHRNSLPNLKRHYESRDSNCNYFDADLSLSLTYKLY